MFSLNNFKEFIYSVERALPIKAYEMKPFTEIVPLVEETTESIFETLKDTAIHKINALKKIVADNANLLLTDMSEFIMKYPEILLDVVLMVFLLGYLAQISLIMHDRFLEMSNEPFKQALKKQTEEQGITLTQPQIDNFLQLYKTDKLKI